MNNAFLGLAQAAICKKAGKVAFENSITIWHLHFQGDVVSGLIGCKLPKFSLFGYVEQNKEVSEHVYH